MVSENERSFIKPPHGIVIAILPLRQQMRRFDASGARRKNRHISNGMLAASVFGRNGGLDQFPRIWPQAAAEFRPGPSSGADQLPGKKGIPVVDHRNRGQKLNAKSGRSTFFNQRRKMQTCDRVRRASTGSTAVSAPHDPRVTGFRRHGFPRAGVSGWWRSTAFRPR